MSFIVMAFNSLYQYSWSVLSPLIASGLHINFLKVSVAFTLFAIFSTASQLAVSPLVDRRGPRLIAPLASLLSAMGFLGTAFSTSLIEFYAFWSAGSVGEGVLYGIASNAAVKWFPDRRGLATGLVSLGFGLGAAVANPFIGLSRSFREASLTIGVVELAALTVISSLIEYPRGLRGVDLTTTVRSPSWWLLYVTFVLSLVPLVSFSSSLGRLTDLKGYLFGVAASLFPLSSGLGRPALGALSDKLGRPRTILASLLIIAFSSALALYGPALAKVVAVSLVGFFNGAQIPLFFSIVGDLYGEAFSTSNNAAMYTGKAFSGLLGGVVIAALIEGGYGAGALVVGSPLLASALMLAAVEARRRGR
ncbi:Putative transport protein [Acidilobus saccharovorans 345-15]|uniref:Putative transport protein n=1 Tax=Acidilobus saccharovorans (strain DSM 16705 / JCM 18335 / VKM B-2471 / 345-15) TaxID=666510 RepID=D9Q0S4_ACIS3|nr:MFS transporter [Acidilobus saccharovorans]ADL18912.1 Putative transport protein [Acidilobus saccharovorans 345-15]